MLTLARAHALLDGHLANSSKAAHSRVVAHLMRRIAEVLQEDAQLWGIVGLCHDLDDLETKGQRSLHGIVTAQWLEGGLPPEALEAIRAHDHRTGGLAATEIANALKLTDALAILDEHAGREAIILIDTYDGWRHLAQPLENRPYLLPTILSTGCLTYRA